MRCLCKMARPGGLEPPTPEIITLGTLDQLSYGRVI